MRWFLACSVVAVAGCLAGPSTVAPQGWQVPPARVETGAGAANLIDVFAQAAPSVVADGFRLVARAGSLNESAQAGLPEDCTDCWVYDVAHLRGYRLQNASLLVDLPEGLVLAAGDASWQGDVEPGERVEFEVVLAPQRAGVWRVAVTLSVAWSDVEGAGFEAGVETYRSVDVAHLFYDGESWLVRSDDAWCPDGSRMDEDALACVDVEGRAEDA